MRPQIAHSNPNISGAAHGVCHPPLPPAAAPQAAAAPHPRCAQSQSAAGPAPAPRSHRLHGHKCIKAKPGGAGQKMGEAHSQEGFRGPSPAQPGPAAAAAQTAHQAQPPWNGGCEHRPQLTLHAVRAQRDQQVVGLDVGVHDAGCRAISPPWAAVCARVCACVRAVGKQAKHQATVHAVQACGLAHAHVRPLSWGPGPLCSTFQVRSCGTLPPACSSCMVRSRSAARCMAKHSGGACTQARATGQGFQQAALSEPAAHMPDRIFPTTADVSSACCLRLEWRQAFCRPPNPHLPLCQVAVDQLLKAAMGPKRRYQHAAARPEQQGGGVDEAGAGGADVGQAAGQSLANVPAGPGANRAGPPLIISGWHGRRSSVGL